MAMKSGKIDIGEINSEAVSGTKNINAEIIMTAIEASRRSKVPVLLATKNIFELTICKIE